MRYQMWLLAAAVLMTPGVRAAHAQTDPSTSPLEITAENVTAGPALGVDDAAAHARPGDVVRYRLRFTNTGPIRVHDVRLVDALPRPLTYVLGSAGADSPGARIEFSIDGGSTYDERPMLVEVVEGRRVERSAPAELYSHIRWNLTDWIEPGAHVTAQFDARVPTVPAVAEAAGSGGDR